MTISVRYSSRALALLACAWMPFIGVQSAGAQADRHTVSGATVAVYNLAGRVIVEPGTGSDVVVEVTRGGRDASKLRIAVDQIRGSNTLRIIYPDDDIVYPNSRDDRDDRSTRDRWSWGGSGDSRTEMRVNDDGTWGGDGRWNGGRRVRVRSRGDGTEAWADLRVLVPTGKTIAVNLGVGALEANRVNADLRLDVSAARVLATGTRGRLDIDAGSGGIEVRDVNADVLNIDTGSGGVRFAGVTGGRCSLDTGSGGITGERISCDALTVDAGSGSVRIDDVRSPEATIETGSGGVRINLLTVPRSLSVESGSGGVSVSMPENTGADVEIETGSGGIETDFALTTNRFERNHLRGRIGNGSGRIRIESGSGSVRLLKSASR